MSSLDKRCSYCNQPIRYKGSDKHVNFSDHAKGCPHSGHNGKPITKEDLFYLCSDEEWEEAERGQHRSGPKPLEHRDIAEAIYFLAGCPVGSRVKIPCSLDHANRKRDAARDHAYRRGISVTTKYHIKKQLVLIEFTK